MDANNANKMLIKTIKNDKFLSKPKFYCSSCDYNTSIKQNWTRHLMTPKHNANQMLTKTIKNDKNDKLFYCICGKKFKHNSSFCRHQKKCQGNSNQNLILCKKITIEEIEKRAYEKGLAEGREEREKEGNMNIEKQTNNIVNNNGTIVNINLLLNEKCADAICIQDFAKSINLELQKLNLPKEELLTNVLLNDIDCLKFEERPFHCSNQKENIFHIKDKDNGWESDDGNKIIKTTDDELVKKWQEEYKNQNPDWETNIEKSNTYFTILGQAMTELEKKEVKKVLKRLGKKTLFH